MQSATPIFVFIFRSLLFAESSVDLRSPAPFFIWIRFFLFFGSAPFSDVVGAGGDGAVNKSSQHTKNVFFAQAHLQFPPQQTFTLFYFCKEEH